MIRPHTLLATLAIGAIVSISVVVAQTTPSGCAPCVDGVCQGIPPERGEVIDEPTPLYSTWEPDPDCPGRYKLVTCEAQVQAVIYTSCTGCTFVAYEIIGISCWTGTDNCLLPIEIPPVVPGPPVLNPPAAPHQPPPSVPTGQPWPLAHYNCFAIVTGTGPGSTPPSSPAPAPQGKPGDGKPPYTPPPGPSTGKWVYADDFLNSGCWVPVNNCPPPTEAGTAVIVYDVDGQGNRTAVHATKYTGTTDCYENKNGVADHKECCTLSYATQGHLNSAPPGHRRYAVCYKCVCA
jgi:hypothetical protein